MEKPRIPESRFTIDQIMHLHINFHKLASALQLLYGDAGTDSKKEGTDK